MSRRIACLPSRFASEHASTAPVVLSVSVSSAHLMWQSSPASDLRVGVVAWCAAVQKRKRGRGARHHDSLGHWNDFERTDPCDRACVHSANQLIGSLACIGGVIALDFCLLYDALMHLFAVRIEGTLLRP